MTIITNTIARRLAGSVALGVIAVGGFASAPAYAQTTNADLQVQIAALQAQIAALMAQMGVAGTTTGNAFTRDLTVGSTGSDVVQLQTWLMSRGFAVPAGATGYFGTQTRAALAAYQSANGIMPSAGYFGPLTRARVNATLTTTPTTPTTPGTVTLSGNGRLTDISALGDIETRLVEGDGLTKVVGFETTATEGDVQLQRVDVEFTVGSSGNQSSNLDRYVDTVSLYLGSTKLATMDARAGDKSGRTWTFRFSNLGSSAVVKNGNTARLYVEVTPVNSINSNEEGRDVTVTIPTDGVRAVGADGISDTYVSSAINQTFTVAQATSGTLTVRVAADNPAANQIAVSSSTTTGKKLLSFDMKAKNADVTINDLAVSLGTSDNNLNDVINTVYLMKGSTILKSKTVSAGMYQVVTFNGVNQTIAEDSTQNFSIVADFKGDAAYADNTTVVASTTTTGWDIEDANGSTVTVSVAAVGNIQTLTATGITLTKGSVPSPTVSSGLSGAGDIATFKIPFTVTAGDTDVYIAGSAQKSSGTVAGKVTYGTTTTSTSGATGEPQAVSVTAADTVNGDSAGTYYKVLAGTSRTFTLTATFIATTTGPVTAGNVGMIINSIAYGATSGNMTNYYTSNIDTFRTVDVFVTKR